MMHRTPSKAFPAVRVRRHLGRTEAVKEAVCRARKISDRAPVVVRAPRVADSARSVGLPDSFGEFKDKFTF